MQQDTEGLMRAILGIAAESAAIKQVLYRANLTTPVEPSGVTQNRP